MTLHDVYGILFVLENIQSIGPVNKRDDVYFFEIVAGIKHVIKHKDHSKLSGERERLIHVMQNQK